MYNCIIIDDEPVAIRIIRRHIENFKLFNVVGEYNEATDAIEALASKQIDLIFLDIQMPGLTGIDFLQTLSNPPSVIFTTAFREYAVEAFDLDVVDYLLKPISLHRFTKSINRFLQLKQKESTPNQSNEISKTETKNYVLLKADRKHLKVLHSDIVYIESMGDYAHVHTQENKLIVKEKMNDIEEMLPSDKFIRIHRSYIVAFEQIKAIGSANIEIIDKFLPIGRNFKENLSGAMK